MKKALTPLYTLARCPLCRQRANTAAGCCASCRADLFHWEVTDDYLALGRYTGKLERAVRAFKFHHATGLGDLFSQELAAAVRAQGWRPKGVCAVPLHPRRYVQRGYNQSALLGRRTARQLGVPYQALLKRTRHTRQQARLNRLERFANVKDAFQAKPVPHGHLLLIDDVMTSGATVDACKAALRRSGAGKVFVATLAKAQN